MQRDQNVILVYEVPGIYITMRGKALENGTEGDVVNVMNVQTKRTLAGTVVGRGQVSISPASIAPATSRLPQTSDTTSSPGATQPAPVAVATISSPAAPKTE